MKKGFLLTLFLCVILLSAADAADNAYADGVYEGEYSFVKVRLSIENGCVSDIEILRHGGGGGEYAEMVTPLCDEIIQRQSTDVNAVSGATVSSENLKKAVEGALKKSSPALTGIMKL